MAIANRERSRAYTLIELLAVIFIIGFATAVFEVVRGKHGQGPAVVACVLALFVGIFLVFLFYRWTWRRNKQQLTRLREKYRNIYQVKALPTDAKSIVKPEGAEIQIGDYGWDARPTRRDGLIHLQGLTARWQVVWHAGFRQDQLKKLLRSPLRNMTIGLPIGRNRHHRRRVRFQFGNEIRPLWGYPTIPAIILKIILLSAINPQKTYPNPI